MKKRAWWWINLGLSICLFVSSIITFTATQNIWLVVLAILSIVDIAIAISHLVKDLVIVPKLTFFDNTAQCELIVKVYGNSDSSVSAKLRLWRGITVLAEWTDTGKGQLSMYQTQTVETGYKYKLTADVKISGLQQPTVSVSKEN